MDDICTLEYPVHDLVEIDTDENDGLWVGYECRACGRHFTRWAHGGALVAEGDFE